MGALFALLVVELWKLGQRRSTTFAEVGSSPLKATAHPRPRN
jgi:hypothetical protein